MATRRRCAIASWSLVLLAASSLAGCDGWDNPEAEDMGRPAGSIDISDSVRNGRTPGGVSTPAPVQIKEEPDEAQVPSAEASHQVP